MKLTKGPKRTLFVTDAPDNYPIVYFRLYENGDKLCIPYTCNFENQGKRNSRQILVVGFRLPSLESVHEQVFYSSTGVNSMPHLASFFESLEPPIQLKTKDSYRLWLPCLGLGYCQKDLEECLCLQGREEETKICYKVLKNFFDGLQYKKGISENGRFGNYNPSLISVSYCLGGSFWDANADLLLEAGLLPQKFQSINKILKTSVCDFKTIYTNPIDCCVDVNCYIEAALPFNYVKELLAPKTKTLRFIQRVAPELKDLVFDYRILELLLEKGLLRRSTSAALNDIILLPVETTFTQAYWATYLNAVYEAYTKDNIFFRERVLPLMMEHQEFQKSVQEFLSNSLPHYDKGRL